MNDDEWELAEAMAGWRGGWVEGAIMPGTRMSWSIG